MIFEIITLLMYGIVFHELGHFIYLNYFLKEDAPIILRRIKGKLKLYTGHYCSYSDLNDSQKFKIYFWGIIGGLIPIFSIAMIFQPSYNFELILAIPWYLIGCKKDILNMIRIIRRRQIGS